MRKLKIDGGQKVHELGDLISSGLHMKLKGDGGGYWAQF